MQTFQPEDIANSKIMCTISHCFLHELKHKNKEIINEGNCLILQNSSKENEDIRFYLKFNNIDRLIKVNSQLFVKVNYETSISYFVMQDQEPFLLCISLLSNEKDTAFFQGFLEKNASVAYYSSSQLSIEARNKIDEHVQNVLQNEIYLKYATTSKLGKFVGNFFGSISKKVSSTSKKLQQSFNNKVENFNRDTFSDETRSKFERFKQKASALNDKLTVTLQPVGQKIKSLASQVSEKVAKSDNIVIKSIKEFSKQAQNSLNQGYKKEVQAKDSLENTQDLHSINAGLKQTLNEDTYANAYPDLSAKSEPKQ